MYYPSMMSNTESLRKKVKHIMVDLELDQKGNLTAIAAELGVTYNSLSMALTGYRKSDASYRYLNMLYEYLQDRKLNPLQRKRVA